MKNMKNRNMQNQEMRRPNQVMSHLEDLLSAFYLIIYILTGPVEYMDSIDWILPIPLKLASDSSDFGFYMILRKGR
jgi:hypothetical protein